jgi:DNA gyrase subunit B
MAKTKTKKTGDYGVDSIKALKGLEAVRERPAMYLGSNLDGAALHHCVEEVVANCVDEHLAGHCTKVLVELLPDGVCRTTDDGRGIPVGPHPEEKVDTLQLVLCTIHAGGKFDRDSYKTSAGLHGVGVSAVNAVSSYCIATVHRGGWQYRQTYAKGVPTSEVSKVGRSSFRGTTIEWQRDLAIFSGVTEYDRKMITDRLQELCFLNPGLKITLEDKRDPAAVWEKEYVYTGGIKDFLGEIVGRKRGQLPILHFKDSGRCEFALTWVDADIEDIRCYANNTRNRDGGTHLIGFKNGLTRLIQNYAKDHGLLRGLGEEGITGSDIRDGLLAVVSVKLGDISFNSQTKDKLVTPMAKTVVEDLFTDQVIFFFNENPGLAKKIAERAVVSAKAREAARKAREQVKRKEWMDPMSLPGKLSDCQSKDPTESELFIIEGDSAAGTTKGARDRRFQAVLPLRGKVLNVERVGVDAILENKELGTIITALGCGIEQTSSFDAKKLRYHKIILMADADVDGAHIRTLLLTFFYRSMPRLIYGGFIYIAMPPLYGGRLGGATNDLYFTGDAELEAFKESLNEEQLKKLKITRYKGLGEMNDKALWATTLDPEQRALRQVTVDDAVKAEQYFGLLMGSDVEARRDFIEVHANDAQHIDL